MVVITSTYPPHMPLFLPYVTQHLWPYSSQYSSAETKADQSTTTVTGDVDEPNQVGHTRHWRAESQDSAPARSVRSPISFSFPKPLTTNGGHSALGHHRGLRLAIDRNSAGSLVQIPTPLHSTPPCYGTLIYRRPPVDLPCRVSRVGFWSCRSRPSA